MEEMNEGITFGDIFKIIKSSFKVIICVTLVLAFIGAAVGAYIKPNKEYGTRLSFYVSDAKLDAKLLELLETQSFAETLLLDENGLTGDKSSEAYVAALEAKQKYESVLKERLEVLRNVQILPNAKEAAMAMSKEKTDAYNSVSQMLAAYLAAFPTDSTAENLIDKAKVAEYEEQLAILQSERKVASDNYAEVLEAYQNALTRQLEIEAELPALKADLDKKTNDLLSSWRQNEDVKNDIKAIDESVEYSYDTDTGNSFITVDVIIPNDKALADKVVDKMLIELPKLVVYNVTDDDTATIPKCSVSSTLNDADELESLGKVKGAVIFGGIAAAGGFVFMCVVAVLADVVKNQSKQDKTSAVSEKKE